jgi:hypothetical protein
VPHTTAPVVTVPDNIVVEATGPSGAVVSFGSSASDIVDGPLTPTCAPASGSTFPVGDTPVTCSVTDSDRLTGIATFHVLVTDTTPPSVHVPANIVAEATGPAGRAVTFAANATDIVDVTDPVRCAPPSGSTFALGHTQVACRSTDAAGNEGASYFDVNIVDTTAPAIAQHANIVANATEPGGAHVSFSLTASDLVDGAVVVTCAPASGSLFPLGHTTVRCSSTDAHHNTSTTSFDVYVKTAALQLQELSALIDSFTLMKGKDKKFENTIANSAKHLARGQLKQVCKELDDLIKKADKESGKSLTAAESDAVVAAARRIEAVVGC